MDDREGSRYGMAKPKPRSSLGGAGTYAGTTAAGTSWVSGDQNSRAAMRTAAPVAAPVASGGGGYGGGMAVAAAPPRPSLRDFIDQDFGYRQAQDEYGDNGRRIREYDAETTRLRGETERDQAVRREDLEADLAQESLDSANDLAGRGLLRSGGLFMQQDLINRGGQQRRSAIDDILTDFISSRGSGRLQQQQQNRSALNDAMNQITQRYQSQYGI